MADALFMRGPDSSGTWCDPEIGLALGHRRLSIIDLSPAGHQPMVSANGRSVISYNGEIYNFKAIRAELHAAGVKLRGHSDTEVLLEAVEHWGIEDTSNRLVGMFAFALWDRKEQILYLVRDRLGIKPLYWGRFGDLFLFGSELKALREHPGCKPEVDRNALAAYMRHGYIPAPNTIYKNISKLSPGTILVLRQGQEPEIKTFWNIQSVSAQGLADRHDISDSEAVEKLHDLLTDAVTCRMIADVPLGALLSGGYDSSTVVALMQANSSSKVKTFSIGFMEQDYNEATHAKLVAAHLGTDHTELYVSPGEARNVIPGLPYIYDEPFADSSQIPTYLVSELTRRSVTVALSGDGGDEIFAGYNRYFQGNRFIEFRKKMPGFMRDVMDKSIHGLSPDSWSRLAAWLPTRYRIPAFGDKLYKLAGIMQSNPDDIYRSLVSHWNQPAEIVKNATEPDSVLMDEAYTAHISNIIERMQLLDTVTYLPDDILTKVDRASMAVSLEARVPLLDHRVVEYAWQLPLELKLRDNEGKWVLKQVLYKYLPRQLVDRPKMGFGVPIGDWLRGPLREWAESLLSRERLEREGFFHADPIRKKWQEHLSGSRNWQHHLWCVLMFQAWHERWM